MRHSYLLALGFVVVGVGASAIEACVGDSNGGPDATADSTTDGVVQKDSPVSDGPTGCAARTADDTTGVFVAPTGSDVNSCGTRANPCKTITYAIATAKAATGKTTIYLAGPNEYDESLTLDAPLTLEGGWKDSGGTWTPICDNTTSTAVTIRGTTNTTLTAIFGGSATLRDLSLKSEATVAPNDTLYGVFVHGTTTNLTLDQVVVDVGGGGAGVDGLPGSTGTDADAGGCTASTGANGTTGANGAGATSGMFTSTGYVAGSGGDGGPAAAGNNGTAGGQGQCSSTCAGCKSNPCQFLSNQTDCAANGSSGCGGGAGGSGSFATSGGASIAVYSWNAQVTVFGGSFTTGNGGNGGNGGVGGDGGAPTNGAAGGNGTCPNADFSCQSNFCVFGTGTTLTGGTTGGKGGAGGSGGQGGGGSGGVSYTFVQGGDAGALTLNGSPAIAHGDGGTGGALGGANGVSGDKWP